MVQDGDMHFLNMSQKSFSDLEISSTMITSKYSFKYILD